jgi:hypothetical protein
MPATPSYPRFAARTVLVIAGLLVLPLVRAAGGEEERREFVVSVDGKQVGSFQMTIHSRDDGMTLVASAAEVAVRRGPLVLYTYSYRGTETWKDGRLVRLDSTTNDNGKRYTVSAAAEANGLRVTVNGQQRLHRADAWPTSYWRLVAARFRDQVVPLLDADTGRALQAQMSRVGVEQVAVAGQNLPCGHFRLRGDVHVDLWYDGRERLARQELVEQGHRTVLELTRYQRTPR